MNPDDDFQIVDEAIDLIEARLSDPPAPVEALKQLLTHHVSWRDTELGTFEEESVKTLGRHTI